MLTLIFFSYEMTPLKFSFKSIFPLKCVLKMPVKFDLI